MRPCRQCRSPIENSVAVCPQCGAAQDDRAKPAGSVPPPVLRRKLFRRAPAAPAAPNPNAPPRRSGFVESVLADIVELLFAPQAFAFLVGLLVLGAVVGGLLGGASGAAAGVAGVVIAIVLFFAFLRLVSSSEG